jgi:radical SAM protein with 4Fe4S-binding SPASM domain
MSWLRDRFSSIHVVPGPTLPGIYHFRRDFIEGKSRVHLRLDADGGGTLIVNADRVLHLNATAALMAYLILGGHDDPAIVSALSHKFRVGSRAAAADLAAFRAQLEELIRPDGACPIHELELEANMPFSARPSAPYRMDLALTYRCNNDCAHCYNARARTFPEMDTGHWKLILSRLWDLGVPHIVFTGGEPTLRADLPELIAYAESLGQITGVNTNGRRLADPDYVRTLVSAGLDHIQITLESRSPSLHGQMVGSPTAFAQTVKGIRNALGSPLFVMTNTTMLRTNLASMPDTLDFLAELGVPTIGLNALIYSGRGRDVGTGLPERDLQPLLQMAAKKTDANGQRLIWYTPTQYCEFDPLQSGLGVKGCTAALYSMCIEPDGAVLPCQSYYRPVGNILEDSWESIWNHDLCVSLRERRRLEAKCADCALLPTCGGGCPLQFDVSAMEHGEQLQEPFSVEAPSNA